LLHGVISLAVGAAGWLGVSSPGDYAAFKFPPLPRHDRRSHALLFTADGKSYGNLWLRAEIGVLDSDE
ncbi:hypothetical protein, partial [Falsigemmobacter intermedius]|uniref:hypothetical protein n=1 Tax=Falsigemmobacter intermedius TaxID=1553448 RepID=UPI0035EE421B